MSFKQKYLKYKQKYLELKNNQEGGYHLSDRTDGFLLRECIKRIESNTNYFEFDGNGNKLPNYGFDETFYFLLNDKIYNQIFEYLISTYNNNKSYNQLFETEQFVDNPNYKIIANFEGMIPYHISIGALMFLSFIIELEIFTLFHSIIPFNTISNSNRNTIPTAFCHAEGLCTKNRIYKDEVSTNVITIFINFTERLDNIFNDFMTKLVTNLTSLNVEYREILKCIVPIDDWRYKEGKFNFIFVDWKERILKITKQTQIITSKWINIKLNETMNQIENQQLMHYIAEATGFFSYMYLVDPQDARLLYGSCITYSMFELYIMSRLHIPGDKLNLLIEKEILQPHGMWKITQKRTSIPILTHYATKFPFSSFPLEFRSIFKSNGIEELPFSTNKNKILKLFIYIIFDMNIEYICKKEDDKVQKIIYFIRKRINQIESLLGSNDIIENLNTDVKIKNYLIELSTSDSSILNNIDLDKVFENTNIRQIIYSLQIDKLIFNAISRNNLELVEKIINLDSPLYINMRYQGKSILEALLSTRINNIYSYLFIKIIKQLKDLKFVYENNNVRQNISVNNINLYKKIKDILMIPNLTYDNLLDTKNMYSEDYVTNEILINPDLIQKINDTRNDRGQSLLYVLCSFRLDSTIFKILKVNEISKENLINVNVQNSDSSTPLHGLLWHGITNPNNFMVYTIIKLLKNNDLDINIKNKFNLTPLDELSGKVGIDEKMKDYIKILLQ